MTNRNILLVVIALLVVVLVIVGGAVLLSQRGSSPSAVLPTNNIDTSIPSTDDNNVDDVAATQPVKAKCGDGVCSPSESAAQCSTDCADYENFLDIRVSDFQTSGYVVSWNTVVPMSSRLDYGLTRDYDLGADSDDVLKTQHELRISGVREEDFVYIRLSGTDGSNKNYEFIGLYITPEGEEE